MTTIDGPRVAPADGGAARGLVILLHGYGADGDDLIGLAPCWADGIPHVGFIAPHAPFPCEMAPVGRQWFSLGDRSSESMLAGTREAARALDQFIDNELQRHDLPPHRLALVGFSQGTMMSLFVALRRPEPIAGVVGYSGRLIGPALLAGETRTTPPVTLVHGSADEMVPATALQEAETALTAAGIAVTATLRPGLGHAIDPPGLQIGLDFLRHVLPA